MIINRELADEIFMDFLRKTEDEDIVLYDGDLYLTSRDVDDDLDTMIRNMRDPHIPLYVFESYKVLDNDDIQFTVRVINIGCHDEIITVSVTEEE